jgi:PAS domain S-box-containing protein
MVRQLVNKMGRRGYFLGFFGMLGLVYSKFLIDPPEVTKTTPNYQQLAKILPLRICGFLWLLMGLVCLVQMWTKRDKLAFGLASGVFGGWGIVYLVGWALRIIPLGYVSATIWLVLAGGSMIVSGWPETDIWVAKIKSLPVITLKKDGRILLLNETAEEMFGYTSGELSGSSFDTLLAEQHRGLIEYPFTTNTEVPILARLKTGEEVPVELNISAWKNKDREGYTATVRRMGDHMGE